MTVTDLLAVKQVFDNFDWDKTGDLDPEEFDGLVSKLLETQVGKPMQNVERLWPYSDGDEGGKITFAAFLRWYSSNGFKEDMLLSEEEQRVRALAKRFNVSITRVDYLKRYFDTADLDSSGKLSKEEFEETLYRILKVSDGHKLPASRIQYFWSEIDADQNGKVAFEEFLLWWLKHFINDGQGGKHTNCISEFYQSFRRLKTMKWDPPAHVTEWRPRSDVEEEPELSRSPSKTIEPIQESEQEPAHVPERLVKRWSKEGLVPGHR